MAHEAADKMRLPLLVVGPADVLRLGRELAALEDYLHQATLRKGGEAAPKLPRTSRMLDDFVSTNELNLLHATDRQRAVDYLATIEKGSPVMTISFAVDPSSAFVNKIIGWLRQNIHPELLLRVGLQPNIGAGCMVRTLNHQYDFSLRKHFDAQRTLLIDKLHVAVREAQK